MYNEYKNGSKYTLHPVPDEDPIEVNLPPVGWVRDRNGKMKHIGVYRRAKMWADCKWEIDPRWASYKQWKAEEDKFKKANPDYIHPKLVEFINDCWDCRIGGFWFYNNTEPVYITGHHWTYLSVIYLDDGKLPLYRWADLIFFYMWEFCKEHPMSYGMLQLAKRRDGKCLGFNTPIRMYDGSAKMVQDIVDGDIVMGINSRPRIAYGITQGREEMFEIKPNKGDAFTCNKSHILSLRWNGEKTHSIYGWEKNGTVNISVEKYLSLKNWELAHLVLYRSGWDVIKKSKDHKIDPYVLGLWLGDGCQSNGVVSIADEEIKSTWQSFCNNSGLTLNYRGKYDYQITMNKNSTINRCYSNSNWWMNCLRELNILNNKHIPKDYLLDSIENRLSLLAGIIDTDGYGSKGRKGEIAFYEVTQKNKSLSEGIVELARSLGFYVSIKEKTAVLKRKGKQDYNCLVYRISIGGDIWTIPCKVERKKCQYRETRFSSGVTGLKVKSIGEGDYYGFAVDGDHLFLLGDGIVTHNTFKAGTVAIDLTTSNPSFKAGIQSKTDDDAKEVFRKAIINPYKKLPYFFQVAKSNMQANGKLPSNELRFIGSKSDDFDDELDSGIDYKPSLEVAYDGTRLGFYFADEVGKPQKIDINARWDVVQFCLREADGTITGKTIHTTTVEDMGGAAEKLMKMWVNSDYHTIKDDVFQTGTGMFRLFIPAQYTLEIDEYGNPKIEESLKKIMSERKAKANDSRALSSVIRKMPTNIKEAFQSDSTSCAFNPIILQKREDELKWSTGEMLYEVGNLYWKDDKEFGEVEFVVNPNGRFKIAMHPPEQIKNGRIDRFGMTMPANNAEFCAGIDPYDHKIKLEGHKSEGKLSKGSIVVLKKTSAIYPNELDEGVACLYLHRTENPEDFYMDAIKCLMYYGCEALIEINRTGFSLWLEKKALENYSAFLPTKNARGITASDKSNSQLAEYTDQYINNYCDKVNFIELVQDWLKFDVSNTTQFDAAMAFGYARMLRKVREDRITNKTEITNITDLFKWYKK